METLDVTLKPQKYSPKVLYVVTEDWYFRTHRLPIALAALKEGYEVVVATRLHDDASLFAKYGIRVRPFSISRRGMNPVQEMITAFRLAKLLRAERPDILHLVALKPILVGNIAARLAGVQHRVSEVAGMGSLFTGEQARSLLARLIRWLLSRLMQGGSIIVQNKDDRLFWKESGLPSQRLHLLPGVGVDTRKFTPSPEPSGLPVVLMASRLLWHKGVGEFVEASRLLKQWGVNARLVLVGTIDVGNPSAVSESQLQEWLKADLIEWWGYQPQMESIYSKAHIVCLPSYYREGLPKVLLEAAACGRPIVATDVPGCREVVQHGKNGLLVPPRDPETLARALRVLIESPRLRQEMGARNRALAEQLFDHRLVVQQILSIYKEMLQR